METNGNFKMYGNGVIFFLMDCLKEINIILSKEHIYDVSNIEEIKSMPSLKIPNKTSLLVQNDSSYYLLNKDELESFESMLQTKRTTKEGCILAMNDIAKHVFIIDNAVEMVLFCINKNFLYGSESKHCTGCNGKLGLINPSVCVAIKKES